MVLGVRHDASNHELEDREREKKVVPRPTRALLSTISTVRTFNFCSKHVGSPGIVHDCTPVKTHNVINVAKCNTYA